MSNYLYNGVELPELPEWDKTVYPYAFITRAIEYEEYPTAFHGQYYLICKKEQIIHGKYGRIYAGADDEFIEYVCSPINGETEWAQKTPNGGNFKDSSFAHLWCNTDILNEADGSIYLAASEPVPLAPTLTARDLYKKVGGQYIKHTLYKKVGGKLVKVDGNAVTLMAQEPEQPVELAAGLYETGTSNLVYSWEQLLGDDVLSGGVVHITDGALSTNYKVFGNSNTSATHLNGDLVLPTDGSVTALSDNAFNQCTQLNSVVIPDSVTTMGNNVFKGCTNLTHVSISNCLSALGMNTFENCTSLTTVTIPQSVTTIGMFSFNNTGLQTAIFEDLSGTWTPWLGTNGHYDSFPASDLSDTAVAATYLRETYVSYDWKKE